ncbi:3'-5' exonuclease [Microbacterium sp. C5A9]|uniref:exonuclease domain-containing protein n=1 Tax=Microbacterium sp. C5A9 TaxID=2736663 RepID=UPI001F52A3EC|nr:exonuclease domain-containing protein [Microbacterium sp. C5A9]MCI1018015.1 3'-5' exonuclease [Microbacterium sp. C5A9]
MTAAPDTPSWIRRVGVFDLETTGVDVENDRIVTAHVGLLDGDGRELASKTWLVDPGIDIPAGATAIHGITNDQVRRDGRPAAIAVTEIVSALGSLLSQRVPVVAYNASYDFSLLDHEARRHGVARLENPQPIIDPLVIDKAYDRYRPGKRTLEAVAARYAVSLEDAHDASADAVAAGRVAQALARQFTLPDSIDDLHTRQVAWARSQAASLTEYFIRIGRLDPEERLDGTWPVRPPRDEEERQRR